MKFTKLFILLLVSSCASKKMAIKELHPLEIDLKVFEETRSAYLAFLEERSAIRKEINSQIAPEDQEMIEELNAGYEDYLKNRYVNNLKIIDDHSKDNSVLLKESFTKMNERWMDKVRCLTDVMTPLMLGNPMLEKKAIYLAKKYHNEVKSITPAIAKAYEKLKNAERAIYLKYNQSNISEKLTKSGEEAIIDLEQKDSNPTKMSRQLSWYYAITLIAI